MVCCRRISLGSLSIKFGGSSYSELYIGSNGYVTFGSGDTRYDNAIVAHYDTPRISLGFMVRTRPRPQPVGNDKGKHLTRRSTYLFQPRAEGASNRRGEGVATGPVRPSKPKFTLASAERSDHRRLMVERRWHTSGRRIWTRLATVA